jgi:HD-like signal output (HDOD) protein
MLSDIGTLLMLTTFPDEAENLLANTENDEARSALEQSIFGFGSQEVSAELASRWRFASAMVDALRWQREPENSKRSELAHILALTLFIQKHRAEQLPPHLVKGAGLKLDSFLKKLDEVLALEAGMEGLLD